MKKFYISFLGLMAVGSLSAQVNNSTASPLTKKNSSFSEKVKPSTVVPNEKVTVLWSDNFSTPSNWAMTNTGTPSHDWYITTDVNAAPYSALTPIATPTAANGYAIIDSDGAGTSTNPSITNANLTWAGAPINLAGNPNVKLNFYNVSRNWATTYTVSVSGNNGSTWTDYVVNAHITTNVNTDNPELYSLDISTVAGNQTQVLIRFNMQADWGWFWAVDDVEIVVTENYDLDLMDTYWGSTGAWGVRLPYYQVPTTQVSAVDFSGIVQNTGVNSQSDIIFTATTAGYSGTSALYTLASTIYDTLDCTTAWTPAASVASHTINFATTSGATDGNPADNTLPALGVDVTNYIYARDAGASTGNSYNAGQGFEAGNIFDIYTADEIFGIDVEIGAAAEAGAEIYAKIYSIDAATGDFVWLDESLPYILTAGDLGSVITMPLQNSQMLNAGEPYLVVVGSFGDNGTTNDLVVSTAGNSSDQTSFYFDMTDQTWYYTTSTPIVRMNFDPSLGINEVENNVGMSVYPNPANTNATVAFELNNEADVTVSVTDLAGKVVYANALGTVNGSQKVNVNTDALTSGVYMVNVTVDGTVSTQKLVIRK